MRHVYLFTTLVVVLAVTVLGFRGTRFTHPPADVFPEWLFPGMKRQPKPRTMGASTFFADGRADRAPVPGTVPSSFGPLGEEFRGDDALYLGKNADGSWSEDEFTGTGFPCVFYLKYHLYRNSFPLYALARFRNQSQDLKQYSAMTFQPAEFRLRSGF